MAAGCARTLLLAAILFFVINTLGGRYQVHGQSMEPSLHDGQFLIASKVTYWLHPPERGDADRTGSSQPCQRSALYQTRDRFAW